jgi:hypothetical protein
MVLGFEVSRVALEWIARNYRKRRDKTARQKVKLIKKLLARAAASDQAGRRFRLSATLLSRLAPAYRVLPLSDYAGGSRAIARLAEPCDYLSEAPRRLGDAPIQHAGTLPAIMGRLFSDARITCNSSAVISRAAICVPAQYPQHPHAVITDPVFLISQENGMGVAHCPDPQPQSTGVAVFGSGALNWYHWLIEILPAAFLAEQLPAEYADFPLLLPEPCGGAGTFRDSAALFAPHRARIVLPVGETSVVRQLIVIDPIANGPMNLRAGQWPRVTDYSQNAEVLRAYRAAILDRLGIVPAPPSRRIFLARSNDRRSFNQTDLIAIAERHGFEAVYPEGKTFREQVQMYAEAQVLLGASGAAFANMLFCQPGARALTWVLPQYDGFCAYSNLAGVVGVTLRYLFATPLSDITSSFDAYSAAYSLDAGEFEAALGQIMDQN